MKSDTKIGIFVVLLLVGVVVVLLGREIMNRKKAAQQPDVVAHEGTDEPLAPSAEAPKASTDVVKADKDALAGGPVGAPNATPLPPSPVDVKTPVAPTPGPTETVFDPKSPGIDPASGPQPVPPGPGVQPVPPTAGPGLTLADAGPKEYVVKAGDRLSDISKQFYGKRSQWTLIKDANPGINPNNLKVGAKLTIPAAPVQPDKAPAVTEATPPASGNTYKVQKGDTFARIAKKVFGKAGKAVAIAKANPTVDAKRLKVGMILNLPEAPAAGAAPAPETPASSKHHAAKATREPWKERGATRLVTSAR